MTESSRLGGGYAESRPNPHPTVEAVLGAARPGGADSRLVVICGPPGVGKTALAEGLLELLPQALCVDKDLAAAGFILAAARAAGVHEDRAYGSEEYWQILRPLEYAGAMASACANLRGRRIVLLVGGWGPELAVDALWVELADLLSPARLCVLHLDPPPLDEWRCRMAGRGSRSDLPWFAEFARSVTSAPVWPGAVHLTSHCPLTEVARAALLAMDISP